MIELDHVRRSCALCRTEDLEVVMKLPATPLANEFVKEPQDQNLYGLTLQLCRDCGHLQLAELVSPDRLFHDYVYVSGTSPVFVEHFDVYATEVMKVLGFSPRLVVDVGSNDGTLLKAFKKHGVENVVGVDPAQEIAEKACDEGIPTLPCFFTRAKALEVREQYGAADIVTANNVFAHAEDLEEIAMGVAGLLSPDGIFVFEVSYLRDVVEKMLFDTVYHEHASYHTLRPLLPFFEGMGLRVFHAERVATHGGSLRVYASRARRKLQKSLDELSDGEQELGLFEPNVYQKMEERILRRGAELRTKIAQWKDDGLRICGYGAPAKLTTLMYAFGLNGRDFNFVIDDSPLKQGLYTPGKNILVLPSMLTHELKKELTLIEERVDVCVVFAWNFFDSIVKKNAAWEGRFVNPLEGA